MKYLPALAFASTGSGRGKTTIVCALLKAFQRKAMRLAAFKTGPDYIDPMFHRSVLRVPSTNLDCYFLDEERLRKLFARDNDAELSVIEGAMGLYDGYDYASDAGSAYDVAKALRVPVVLVVDARGMGYSLAAEIAGFLAYDQEKLIAGVIFNRMSKGYYSVIKPVIEKELGIKVFGYFPVDESAAVSSRYLGLTLPNEIDDLHTRLEYAADVIEKTVELDALADLAKQRATLEPILTNDPHETRDSAVKIAVARDPAFCFYYEENLRLLREAGAELVEFSPLNDDPLPEGAAGLVLGGGYPELYAEKLAAASAAKASLRRALDQGIPCLAECGGFMYLHDRIVTENGKSCEMLGYLPGECRYQGKLTRFGYVEIVENNPAFYGGPIRAHEFHYYDGNNNGGDCTAVKPNGRAWQCAHVSRTQWLGFAHLYYASAPGFAETFVERCGEYGEK